MDEIVAQQSQELLSGLQPFMSHEDLKRVNKAFLFAEEAHSPQRRKSGEPYILHPLAVARIVGIDLQLDADMVCAALLHDVVEDTPHSIDEIEREFGNGVADLVEVVTKKNANRYRQSKQIDNFRQILQSIHNGVKALLIKLADRLHNMRTLESMRADKQMKIAGETDYFYAPLANRLGLYHIKTELENLSFKFRCPADYCRLEEKIENYKDAMHSQIDAFTAHVNRELAARGIEAHTEVRYRMPAAIWRKMNTRDSDFDHVEGKHYIRVVFPESSDHAREKEMALNIYSALTDVFKEKPGSTTNYIDSPKENGYESFHVKLLNSAGVWEEIHIASERMLRESRLGQRGEVNDRSLHIWLNKFRGILDDAATQGEGMDFLDAVTSTFYNDDIRVYTPKGKEIILPKNASALDFAFEIHTDVGHRAAYARINGKLCSLKTVLRRGDVVQIGTRADVQPQKDWLDAVSTYKARKELRAYFKALPKLPFVLCKKCCPLPGDEVIGIRHKEYSAGVTKPSSEEREIVVHKRNCQEAIRTASRHADRITTVDFNESPDFQYPVLLTIRGVDRFHLLRDIIDCITEDSKLNMHNLTSENRDNITTVRIGFYVHSVNELDRTINAIRAIQGVDEVLYSECS